MNIQIASDLHLEFLQRDHPGWTVITPNPAADVLILAGDIAKGTYAIEQFADWPVPVMYIAGNHEFYHHAMLETVQALRGAAQGTNVHFLENDELVLYGVRFLACTLWTDYELYVDPRAAMVHANLFMNDHRLIKVQKNGRKFLPADARRLHLQSRAWLEDKLAEPFAGSTVVVTHHGPHPNSIAVQYLDDPSNPAFHSDLTALMGKARLWVHGHTHASCRYSVSGTEVVANPCGYPRGATWQARDTLLFENEDFDRALVVEVPSPPVVRLPPAKCGVRRPTDEERYFLGRENAEELVSQVVTLPPAQIRRLVKMVFGNNGKISGRKRKQFVMVLSDEAVRVVEEIVHKAFSVETLDRAGDEPQ